MKLGYNCEQTYSIKDIYLTRVEAEKQEFVNGRDKRNHRRKTNIKLKGKRKYGY